MRIRNVDKTTLNSKLHGILMEDPEWIATFLREHAVFNYLDILKFDSRARDLFDVFQTEGFHLLPVHYYSPIPNLDNLTGISYVDTAQSKPEAFDGLDAHFPQIFRLLEICSELKKEFDDFLYGSEGLQAHEFFLSNPNQHPVDAALLYCIIRSIKPKNILEVGMGYSTMISHRALEVNSREGSSGHLMVVEPFPEENFQKAVIQGLRNITVIQEMAQHLPMDLFSKLGSGDILFIDSSHVVKMGSDCLHLFLHILPNLCPGVIVHVHDVFLPYEYPKAWITKHRFWNEQYFLHALMANSKKYKVIMPTAYMNMHFRPQVQGMLSRNIDGIPGSFWIESVTDPRRLWNFHSTSKTGSQGHADVSGKEIKLDAIDDHSPDVMEIRGIATKAENGPILSASNSWTNRGSGEYRVRKTSWYIEYDGIRSNESVESDICLTIFDDSKQTSLQSREELLCVHEHVHGEHDYGISRFDLPMGGFRFPPGSKLSIAGVSNIYPTVNYTARLLENRRLLSVVYSIEIERESSVQMPPISSVRSPQRDRSSVPNSARKILPSTSYLANGTVPIAGVGVFLSSISHVYPSEHRLEILINGKLKQSFDLPPHKNGHTTQKNDFIPLDLVLQGQDIITAQFVVITSMAIVFDGAIYIFCDETRGDLVAQETEIFPSEIDLNGDGAPDYLDLDEDGSLWADLTITDCFNCTSFHDTQFEWAKNLPWGREAFAENVRLKVDDHGKHYLEFHDEKSHCCMKFLRRGDVLFELEYCNQSNVPAISPHDLYDWGDLDGDGWIDRLRISCGHISHHKYCESFVALGSSEGLLPEIEWTLLPSVDKVFIEKIWDSDKCVVVLESASKNKIGVQIQIQFTSM
ncbi:hypothetical protein M9434_002533 [Picochlorum sp. BPE23]|nr:hypothetical protein M9434_002533 [Picochlorum sp. BPE23]